MHITSLLTDEAVLREIGSRIAEHRLSRNVSQAELARQAGVGRRTLQRLEAGEPVELTAFVRALRALGLLDALERLLPAPAPSPIAALALAGRQRRRARPRSSTSPKRAESWRWGDEQGERE